MTTAVIDRHLVTVTGVDDKAVLVWDLTGYRYQRQVASPVGDNKQGALIVAVVGGCVVVITAPGTGRFRTTVVDDRPSSSLAPTARKPARTAAQGLRQPDGYPGPDP